ncbi:DUF2285 domain-containing protein [Novosphingobium sp. P6W]|uniref:DUF2285 domain-containing protein n=1 Tax=Novosphingobium sp. P6W TaxID=1609758 RepID=UPI0009E32D48|nr:DUF2285 domain-containing protein [Novosphingobium sp. P6W]AXB76602.1 DUF2285 domain-containing protein [Novosphingobium sp. P6W]
MASLAPDVIILDAAPPGSTGAPPLRLEDAGPPLVDRGLANGRHLVLADGDGRHRLWLREPATDGPLACVIPWDEAFGQRLGAVRRLERHLADDRAAMPEGTRRATAFQQRRLNLLLDIVDALGPQSQPPPSTYEIAARFVYPRMTIGRGAEWKSSSERRRTQRLIKEALELVEMGYLRLLCD